MVIYRKMVKAYDPQICDWNCIKPGDKILKYTSR
jgi:hypothetical protein